MIYSLISNWSDFGLAFHIEILSHIVSNRQSYLFASQELLKDMLMIPFFIRLYNKHFCFTQFYHILPGNWSFSNRSLIDIAVFYCIPNNQIQNIFSLFINNSSLNFSMINCFFAGHSFSFSRLAKLIAHWPDSSSSMQKSCLCTE